MRIRLNSCFKMIQIGWVILLLSVLFFSCKKEVSEKEKVERFVTNIINSIINEQIFSKERNRIARANNIYTEKANLLLVVKDFKIIDTHLGKCPDFLTFNDEYLKKQSDCYTVSIFYTKKHHLDYKGNRKKDGRILFDESGQNVYVRIVENEIKILFGDYIGSILSEHGEEKFLEYVKKRK